MRTRQTYNSLIEKALAAGVSELMPWDLIDKIEADESPLLLDIREPLEFEAAHITGSLNVPRGTLEAACEYDFEDTSPELVEARDREIIVICRSGNRSVLAAATLGQLGYKTVLSLKTGVRGWNDYELPLVDINNKSIDIDEADGVFTTTLKPEQIAPTNQRLY